MQMTESEICANYRQAKNKNEQVGILADLNCVTKQEIVDILSQNGYITGTPAAKAADKLPEEKPRKTDGRSIKRDPQVRREQYIGLADKGFTVAETAVALEVTETAVRKYAQRNGIRFADYPAEKKAAPAAGTAKAARPSKEGASKHIQHSTKPAKKQAAAMVPETVGACADKSGEPLDMISALQFLLWEAVPQIISGAKITRCEANDSIAMVAAEAQGKEYELTLEVLSYGANEIPRACDK